MDKTKIVFDVDDTICSNTRKLSYDKCVPDFEVIKKINDLHDNLGFTIVLHTARGMVSCNGDYEKIVAKNKKVLEDWLKKYDVHYDELIFCKPIADLYVDDKAMNVSDFKKETFEVLHGGGSKKPIYKLGNVVKKVIGSEKDTTNFKDWVEDNHGSCLYPRVISYLYDSVYMDYIDGDNLADCFTFKDLTNLLAIEKRFSMMKVSNFSMVPQIEILNKNYCDDPEFNMMIDLCKAAILNHKDDFAKNASYSHGDLILSNVIKSKKDGKLYLIDSRYMRDSSSYLFDLAKLRNSLSGYEYIFGISDKLHSKFLPSFDYFLDSIGVYDLVVILHLMYVLRLYRYKNDTEKEAVKYIAKGLINRNEAVFFGN